MIIGPLTSVTLYEHDFQGKIVKLDNSSTVEKRVDCPLPDDFSNNVTSMIVSKYVA